MEFSFNINNLLGNTITKLDKGVDPYRRNAEGLSYIVLRSQLFQVIDEMGAASAKAQGLRTIITTGRKLELSDHILYIMKDAEANKGKGAVVGLLKIGYKKLFVYDSLGGNHELVPMCVLDFYVHESRQRMGCGKMLFECMLKDQNIQPCHLAIDKPSFKFSKFLAKHYGLKDEIQQVNNFVVFDGFFQGHKSMGNQRRLLNRPPSHPNRRQNFNDNNLPRHGQASAPVHYGRQVNGRPWSGNNRSPSGRMSNRSQQNNDAELRQLYVPVRPPSDQRMEIYNMDMSNHVDTRNMPQVSPRAYGAGASQYSRHTATPPHSRPTTGNNARGINVNQNAETNQLIRKQDRPSADLYNLHQDYQGRGGSLKVINGRTTSLPSLNDQNMQKKSIYMDPKPQTYQPFVEKRNTYSLFDAPPDHRSIAARQYTHTRIW